MSRFRYAAISFHDSSGVSSSGAFSVRIGFSVMTSVLSGSAAAAATTKVGVV